MNVYTRKFHLMNKMDSEQEDRMKDDDTLIDAHGVYVLVLWPFQWTQVMKA